MNELLEEATSKYLNIPFVTIKDDKGEKVYVCSDGVAFWNDEFQKAVKSNKEWVKEEAEKRKEEGLLYDYNAALRGRLVPLQKEEEKPTVPPLPQKERQSVSVLLLCLALAATSIGSMYISTIHTATYLFDYVDRFSAWVMSAVITLYCASAFEVILLFNERKSRIMSVIFAVLWTSVVVFSMATTVSVFYDRYNFKSIETATVNTEAKREVMKMEMLQKQEAALREEIEFKKKDIEYRRQKDYATNTRTLELNDLQKKLQEVMEKENEIVANANVINKEEVKEKESLFVFLGHILHIDGGILEFIMSTLSAVFINLISPLSVSVVVSFTKKETKNENC